MNGKFLLISGVSGVGKSWVIGRLRRLDEKFVYVRPVMTRPLRDGETEKISVTDDEFDAMEARGEFVAVNLLYGFRYGTPRAPILEMLESGRFPVLDWPVEKLTLMQREFPGQIFSTYLFPPSLEELKRRLDKDSRDSSGSRLAAAKLELDRFHYGEFDCKIDLAVEMDGLGDKIPTQILEKFLASMT